MPAPIIVCEKLTKTFAHRKRPVEAVRGLDLAVSAGEIFGLIGPNGAGKTTAMRMLCTLLTPTGGTARVAGYDLATNAKHIRDRIGYVGQKGGMETTATGRENLVLHAQLYGMSTRAARRRIDELIARLNLGHFADRKTETYSGGQRRIMDLASGVINSPSLLFLDEPSTGLDPQSRARVWDEVRGVHAQGATIFLTTHYLEEADELCGRVAVFDHGRIVALGSPAELKKQVAGDTIVLAFATPASVAAASAALRENRLILEKRETDAALHLVVEHGEAALPVILGALGAANAAPTSIALNRPSLDDVFLKLTGRSLRDSEEESGGEERAA